MDYFRIIDLVGVQIAMVIMRAAQSADLSLTIPIHAFGYELQDRPEYPFLHITIHVEVTDKEESLEDAINEFCDPRVMNDRVLKILEHRQNDLRATVNGSTKPAVMSFTVH